MQELLQKLLLRKGKNKASTSSKRLRLFVAKEPVQMVKEILQKPVALFLTPFLHQVGAVFFCVDLQAFVILYQFGAELHHFLENRKSTIASYTTNCEQRIHQHQEIPVSNQDS
jgi:hypothetical protein